MTNASIFFHPDGYDTTGARLMGRHSAGESFLRGFLRHADVETFYFFNGSGGDVADLNKLITRIEPPTKPVRWSGRRARGQLGEAGCLFHPGPSIATEAWSRRPFDSRRYSLTGITHTTATHRVMDILADMMTAPLEPWDALICTSSAVRDSVETQLQAVREDLAERVGATRFASPQLATIPLGVNASDFAPKPADRKAWREKLNIPPDAFVALYVGRFSAGSKMNPALMAMTLEAATQQTGQPIYWIVSGWAGTEATTEAYHAQTREFCPSVHYVAVDGRPADTRFSIWSAADIFISLSENIQETFGLTPIEAMAAGLPCVVTDWNGYRDTVRDGVDGIRIKTFAPRPGLGRDLAFGYANEWSNYDQYVTASSQMTAVDLGAATQAVVALVNDPELRVRMGKAGRRQAAEVFDWATIIPQYQALWGDLAARRRAAPEPPASRLNILDNPRRLDPFYLFAGYPTEALTSETLVSVKSDMTWELAKVRLSSPLGAIGQWAMPLSAEREAMFAFVAGRGLVSIAELLAGHPAPRHPFLERGVLWMAKFGILQISPDGPFLPKTRKAGL